MRLVSSGNSSSSSEEEEQAKPSKKTRSVPAPSAEQAKPSKKTSSIPAPSDEQPKPSHKKSSGGPLFPGEQLRISKKANTDSAISIGKDEPKKKKRSDTTTAVMPARDEKTVRQEGGASHKRRTGGDAEKTAGTKGDKQLRSDPAEAEKTPKHVANGSSSIELRDEKMGKVVVVAPLLNPDEQSDAKSTTSSLPDDAQSTGRSTPASFTLAPPVCTVYRAWEFHAIGANGDFMPPLRFVGKMYDSSVR